MNREIAVSLGRFRKRAAATKAGAPSFPKVRDQVRDQIGDPVPHHEWFRRWHTPGEEPTDRENLPIQIAVGLAIVYDERLRDIHPDLEGQLERLLSAIDKLKEQESARQARGDDSDRNGGGGSMRPFRPRRRRDAA